MWSTLLKMFLIMLGLLVPTIPTIPSTANAENTYYITTGHLCMTGEQFHTLSDDVYGTHTGQGVYNEYIVRVWDYPGYDYFRVSISMSFDNRMIVELSGNGKSYTATSSYWHFDTPVFKLPNGVYTVKVGFLHMAKAPAAYRINMG